MATCHPSTPLITLLGPELKKEFLNQMIKIPQFQLSKEIKVLILKERISESGFVTTVVILLTESEGVLSNRALIMLTSSLLEITNGLKMETH